MIDYATCAESQPWRETEDAYIIKFRKKLSIKQMAHILGRTQESVKQRMIELGISKLKKTYSTEDIERFAELYNQGLKIADIAAELGINSNNTVDRMSKRARRLGLIDAQARKRAKRAACAPNQEEPPSIAMHIEEPKRRIPEHLRVRFLEFILYEVLQTDVQLYEVV